eukprot:1169343-Amphidinium_carterae.1
MLQNMHIPKVMKTLFAAVRPSGHSYTHSRRRGVRRSFVQVPCAVARCETFMEVEESEIKIQ